MKTSIGINGFGRMGRLALRAAWGWPDFEFVHINEVEGRQRGRARTSSSSTRCMAAGAMRP